MFIANYAKTVTLEKKYIIRYMYLHHYYSTEIYIWGFKSTETIKVYARGHYFLFILQAYIFSVGYSVSPDSL